MSLRQAAQAVVDSLGQPDSAVERLRCAKLLLVLRLELMNEQLREEASLAKKANK